MLKFYLHTTYLEPTEDIEPVLEDIESFLERESFFFLEYSCSSDMLSQQLNRSEATLLILLKLAKLLVRDLFGESTRKKVNNGRGGNAFMLISADLENLTYKSFQ